MTRDVNLERCINNNKHTSFLPSAFNMSSNKRQNLVLAPSSISNLSLNKCFRTIILFNDKNISRSISKACCEWVDAETVSLTVRSIAILKCFRSDDIRTIIKRRAGKCVNLRSFVMIHEEVFIYLTCFDFLKDLLITSPGILKLQSSHVSNWLVTTSTGTNLFNSYVPHSSLTVDNVVDILVLSLMAEDVNTLHKFYSIELDDLVTDGHFISLKSQLRLNQDNVRCCLHYTDGSNRPVTLKKDMHSSVWEVNHIGRKVSVQCVICSVCVSKA